MAEERKSKTIYRVLANICKAFLYFIWPTRIYFKERVVQDKRAIFICNHYSYWDTNPILGSLFGKKSNIVMKSELANSKFIENIMCEVGGIPIKRGSSDIDAIKKILIALKKDEQVLIYPEGQRNPNDCKEMLPFKEGVATFALKTEAQIVPMMHYRRPRLYKFNYLMVGEPFDISQFYGQKTHDVKTEATQFINQKMLELREEIDILVEKCHGSKRKYLIYKKKQEELKKIEQKASEDKIKSTLTVEEINEKKALTDEVKIALPVVENTQKTALADEVKVALPVVGNTQKNVEEKEAFMNASTVECCDNATKNDNNKDSICK